MNEYINITSENIKSEHLCCALADKKHQNGVDEKRNWILSQLPNGHIFRKLNSNGKVFVEYQPLQTSWTPICGDNYMYIYCLWVAGSYKGKGYAKELLQYAIDDAKSKNMSGICTISSKKKKPFVGEKSFFQKYGFEVCDSTLDYELLALSFDGSTPKFMPNAKLGKIEEPELTIYYSPQCPFTAHCVIELTQYCEENNRKVVFHKIDSLEKAKNLPCVFNNWAVFLDGKFVGNTLLNANSLDKLLNK